MDFVERGLEICCRFGLCFGKYFGSIGDVSPLLKPAVDGGVVVSIPTIVRQESLLWVRGWHHQWAHTMLCCVRALSNSALVQFYSVNAREYGQIAHLKVLKKPAESNTPSVFRNLDKEAVKCLNHWVFLRASTGTQAGSAMAGGFSEHCIFQGVTGQLSSIIAQLKPTLARRRAIRHQSPRSRLGVVT